MRVSSSIAADETCSPCTPITPCCWALPGTSRLHGGRELSFLRTDSQLHVLSTNSSQHFGNKTKWSLSLAEYFVRLKLKACFELSVLSNYKSYRKESRTNSFNKRRDNLSIQLVLKGCQRLSNASLDHLSKRYPQIPARHYISIKKACRHRH